MQSIDTDDTDEEDINNNNNTKHVEGVSLQTFVSIEWLYIFVEWGLRGVNSLIFLIFFLSSSRIIFFLLLYDTYDIYTDIYIQCYFEIFIISFWCVSKEKNTHALVHAFI